VYYLFVAKWVCDPGKIFSMPRRGAFSPILWSILATNTNSNGIMGNGHPLGQKPPSRGKMAVVARPGIFYEVWTFCNTAGSV